MAEDYKTAEDVRRALEQRLRNVAVKTGRSLLRERQVLVFERFLARAFAEPSFELVVKGGMALELRTSRARSTRDIDLRASGAVERFEQALRELGERDVGDYLRFEIKPHGKPDLEAAGMKYPGRRFRVQAWLADKVYADPFGVDVAFGEPMIGAPERLQGRTATRCSGAGNERRLSSSRARSSGPCSASSTTRKPARS